MKGMIMKRIILTILVVMSLSGCVTLPTGPSVSMSPPTGKPIDIYQTEDGKCRQYAERQLGKDYDYFSTQEAQYHYDNVYVQCMSSHGNRIQPPAVYRWYRISRPPPQDYNAPPPENYSVPPPDTPPPPD